MEALGLGDESELQVPAYAMAIATPDPSRIYDLHQRWTLNPLSEARDQTHVLRILVGFVTAEPQRELRSSFLP